MKLYHFTFALPLLDIFGLTTEDPTDGTVIEREAQGIKPSLGLGDHDNGHMTKNQPVVWLTLRDSVTLTPDDLEWLNSPICPLNSVEKHMHRTEGYTRDRTVVLAVDLSPNSKRLRHYGNWLRENGLEHIAHYLSPHARTDWWIYFGTVPPNRIVGINLTGNQRNDPETEASDAAIRTIILKERADT